MGSINGRRAALSTGRLRRTAVPARLAAAAGMRWALTRLAVGERRQARQDRFVLHTADDVTRALGEMKGAAMKLGQVLSLMTGMVPTEMAAQLATLQSQAPPMAYGLVEDVFAAEFGMPPHRVFREFEREPFAAASIGQVHRARLGNGTAVAVKVQYPGVAEAIDHDLANVSLLFTALGMAARGLDTGVIVRDLAEGIRAELDYHREAASQQRFFDIYRGHGFVRVPQVYPEFTTRRVLVQEYVEGRPFMTARDLPQEDRNRVAEMVYRFSFGNIYRHGLFNGDPHPGNYLLTPDGGVAFVDYGCVAEFDRETVGGFVAIIDALLVDDREAWRRECEAVGILRPGAPFTTAELYDHMHWFWAPILGDRVTFTPELASEMVRRNSQTTGDGGRINRWLNIPQGMVFLTRINFGLAGLFASLDAEGPWRGIIREYIYDEAPVSDLGRLSRATSVGDPI